VAFELPRLVDLTDDQLTILNASYDKNMIVSGAPGTGKSVLAIYRAADLSKHNKRTLLLIYNKPLNQSRIEMCQAIQAMLLDIGVQCSVEVLEFGSYISRTTAGEHDMAYFGWTTSSGDADYTYYSLEHSTQQGAAGNRSFIADPDLDALIEEARSNTDESTRKDLYKDIAIMLAEINNNIPVFYSAINVGANKKVEGFVMDSNGYHNLNQVKVAQ